MAGRVQSSSCLAINLLAPSLKFCLRAQPREQQKQMSCLLAASIIYTHCTGWQQWWWLPPFTGHNWFSPPNYEALAGKLWPAAPGVYWCFRLQISILQLHWQAYKLVHHRQDDEHIDGLEGEINSNGEVIIVLEISLSQAHLDLNSN